MNLNQKIDSKKWIIFLYSPLYSKHLNLGVFKQKKPSKHWVLKVSSGASRDRTDDPLLAKQVLSHLSYSPVQNTMYEVYYS